MKRTKYKSFKGFGKPKDPRFWVEVVYCDEDRPSDFLRLNCSDENVQNTMDRLVQDTAVDCCVLLKGTTDIESPKVSDILLAGERDT